MDQTTILEIIFVAVAVLAMCFGCFQCWKIKTQPSKAFTLNLQIIRPSSIQPPSAVHPPSYTETIHSPQLVQYHEDDNNIADDVIIVKRKDTATQFDVKDFTAMKILADGGDEKNDDTFDVGNDKGSKSGGGDSDAKLNSKDAEGKK